MGYTNYTEVVAQLNTSWDTDVIAKPTFKDWQKLHDLKPTNLYIGYFGATADKATTGATSKDNILTTWKIRAVAESKVNIDKYLDEIRRILNAYDLTNGFWHVVGWTLQKTGKLFYYELNCRETFWDFA